MKKTKRILIMGLPGSGKTYFAERLKKYLEQYSHPVNEMSLMPFTDAQVSVVWYNADDVRKKYDNWDFSNEGRIRQSHRMRDLADASGADYCIVDFVAPLPEMRFNYKADWTIWIDTINAGRFEDTNKLFQPPTKYRWRVDTQNAEFWSKAISEELELEYNPSWIKAMMWAIKQ